MKPYEEYLMSLLSKCEDKNLFEEVKNYLLKSNYDINNLSITEQDGSVSLRTNNRTIKIEADTDGVYIDDNSLVDDVDSPFFGSTMNHLILMNHDRLDIKVIVTNAANYYTGLLWGSFSDNVAFTGDLFDSFELKHSSDDFKSLNELAGDLKENHILLSVCAKQIENSLTSFVKANQERYEKSLKLNKK